MSEQPIISKSDRTGPVDRRDPNRSRGLCAPLFRAAAQGDLSAHRKLRDASLVYVGSEQGRHEYAGLAIVEALVHARACAAVGDTEDVKLLAGVLLTGASIFGRHSDDGPQRVADGYGAEALALLEDLAEAGDDEAAVHANDVIAMMPPHALALARSIHALEDVR